MSRRVGPLVWGVAAAVCGVLALAGGGRADGPLSRLFGPRTPAKKPAEDTKRQTEIAVELAWLADPVTFPYYLEARVEGGRLEVRGYVPNPTVRDHALRIARVHSPLAVGDAMKEHPSLLVRPSLMAPAQLQQTVVSSLREALPRQYQGLKVQCGTDGEVTVRGPVRTREEKLLVSHALRRLHGCTSVKNLTRVDGEPEPPAVAAAPPPPPRPPEPTARPEPKAPRPRFGLADAKKKDVKPGAAKTEKKPDETAARKKPVAPAPEIVSPPPREVPSAGPRLLPFDDKNVPATVTPKVAAKAEKVEVKVEPKSPPAKADPALARQLQKRVLEKCTGARDVRVEFKTATDVVVELTIERDEQINTFAGVVFNLPELQPYQVELQFKVGTATAP
jgi:osmotically-inducible protein OsmY